LFCVGRSSKPVIRLDPPDNLVDPRIGIPDSVPISLVIPTFNRASLLKVCLQALSAQTQPAGDFEVIVVVDGSTDHTREVLAQSRFPYQLRVLCQSNKGQPAALNLGVKQARGRYLLFLDDDMLADPRLIAEHLRVQNQQQEAVVIGQIRLKLPPRSDWFVRCVAERWRSHYERLNRQKEPPSWTDCYSGNLSVPRAAVLRIGGFALDLPRSYDIELGYRLFQLNLPLVYAAAAVSVQEEQKTFRELTLDAERAGFSCVRLWRRYPETLPQLLGSFNEAKPRERLLRRVLLSWNIPPQWIARAGSFCPHPSWTSRLQFLYDYSYWRGVRKALSNKETWRRLTHNTLILMYHAFGGREEPPSRFILPAQRFARQMAWLSRLGYNVLGLEEFLSYRREGRLPPAPSVVITIDDGYEDNYTRAFPILRHHKFPATIFLVSQKLGQDNHWDEGSTLTGRPLLSLAQVKEMFKEGIRFGAHTRTHPHLSTLGDLEIREEIYGSKQDLEKMLNVPIQTFAYPYGDFNAAVTAVAEGAGFEGSCSVESGANSPRTPLHMLRRVEVRGTDSFFCFLMTLWSPDRRCRRKRG
jgi:peptidoglycan/xylan/chitin deacetylase (PgdA/CDA1 family)/glycosyltransferase involved in cell wall biosynthesis